MFTVAVLRVDDRGAHTLLNVDRAIILDGLHSVIKKLLAAPIVALGASYTLSRVSFPAFYLVLSLSLSCLPPHPTSVV